ncbi:MAG: class I SAM-dependent methyltransferase [Acidobacteriota bacterium]
MTKTYDRAYFDKWYRRQRVHAAGDVRRKVALAVSLTEYFLRRPLRSVLDIGCGEGAWFPHLRDLRPRVSYLGLDPSPYVVRRFGRARNIRQASFGELAALRLLRTFDLVVCSDVLHYVPDDEIVTGLREIARMLGGVAFLEVLTADDDIVGDLEGLLSRRATWYHKVFGDVGLAPIGPYSWLAPGLRTDAAALELTQPHE